jgi:HSP20 family molecular chaperone IbpA
MQTNPLENGAGAAVAEKPAKLIFTPEADIIETADGYTVDVYMPGVSEATAEVTLENDALTVSGRVEQAEVANLRPVYREYETGDYRRVFTLADHVDRAKVSATVRDGVLHLVLPKAESSRPKRIAVKAA